MTKIVENVTVTIPEKDIKERQADVVKEAPKRFSVWWDVNYDFRTKPHEDPDITVPNEMIIVEY